MAVLDIEQGSHLSIKAKHFWPKGEVTALDRFHCTTLFLCAIYDHTIDRVQYTTYDLRPHYLITTHLKNNVALHFLFTLHY